MAATIRISTHFIKQRGLMGMIKRFGYVLSNKRACPEKEIVKGRIIAQAYTFDISGPGITEDCEYVLFFQRNENGKTTCWPQKTFEIKV